ATRVMEALAQVRAVQEAARALLEDFDVLLTPATPLPAPKIGDEMLVVEGQSYPVNVIVGRCMTPINAAQLPALVQPCGFTADGLPIGLQWIAKPFDEAAVIRAGAAYERATDWHTRRAPVG